jgi:hypothetical protein
MQIFVSFYVNSRTRWFANPRGIRADAAFRMFPTRPWNQLLRYPIPYVMTYPTDVPGTPTY